MDVEGFLAGLPALFADFPRSQVPRDRSLATVVEQVDGLSEENNLALLALAARHLGDGECYLEAGAYHGRTLIGVATGSAASCVAIDNFSYDGVSRASLTATLDRFGVADRVRVVDADTGDALDTQTCRRSACSSTTPSTRPGRPWRRSGDPRGTSPAGR
jgi:hypothetical protein